MTQRNDGSPSYGLAEAVEGLEALIGQQHIAEDYVRFRAGLLKAQWAVRETLEKSLRQTERKPNGKPRVPALDAETVAFDRELLASLCEALRDTVAGPGDDDGEVPRLAAAAKEDPTLLDGLVRATAFGPDREYLELLSERLDISADALLFVGRMLAAPFVAVAARHVGGASPPIRVGAPCAARQRRWLCWRAKRASARCSAHYVEAATASSAWPARTAETMRPTPSLTSGRATPIRAGSRPATSANATSRRSTRGSCPPAGRLSRWLRKRRRFTLTCSPKRKAARADCRM